MAHRSSRPGARRALLATLVVLGLSACSSTQTVEPAVSTTTGALPTLTSLDAPVGVIAVGAPCGAGLGDCDATAFCRFPSGSPCGEDGVTGVCELRPVGCRRDCPGVCGCNGARFCNACVAESRGFSVRDDDTCKEKTDETP
jgi:hypothetical protein